jgi:hypothetical protein
MSHTLAITPSRRDFWDSPEPIAGIDQARIRPPACTRPNRLQT